MLRIIQFLILVTIASQSFAQQSVNLYSARKEALIKPLLNEFTAETGITVNLITSKADALLSRIKTEGQNSPADVLLTTDAGRLYRAKEANLFASINSETLETSIPENYQDKDNQWFGLSVRVRPIIVVKGSDVDGLQNYEDLANEKWKNQICIRSSSNIYNQSLIASMIVARGEQATEEWAAKLVNNLAREPEGGDTDQIRAAASGQCNIAIANTYYLGKMLSGSNKKETDLQDAQKMQIIWPNQNDRGAHANVSGAGVLKTSPNRENAIKLIEFLASDKAQKIYADVNFEFPVRENIQLNPILANWGEFKTDSLNLTLLGENNAAAVKLMDRVGWK